MQKRGQASPDDGDALALTFAQPVEPAEVEEPDEIRRVWRLQQLGVDGVMPDYDLGNTTTLGEWPIGGRHHVSKGDFGGGWRCTCGACTSCARFR
jgi:hypothetical protein